MTNVPQEIRTIWTDLYKLFDLHWKMDGSAEAWKAYWDDANKIWNGSNKNERVLEAVNLIADTIGDRFKEVV